MIFIGTDIVAISRIDSIIRSKGDIFLNHIYSSTEQNICNSKISPSVHYSGKFAAKEAVKKAILSSKYVLNISLKSIEIKNDNLGAPIVNILKNDFESLDLKVTISHTEKYATATAIFEMK